MPRLTAAKRVELKSKFAEFDRSGDNKLNFQEMKELLTKGNPNLEEKDLKKLFNRVDKNGDGTVDFDEFIAYLYDHSAPPVLASAAANARFTEFCGGEMDGTEFSKLCLDCNLLDDNFKNIDVAATFAKVVPRGKRNITLKQGTDGFSQYDKLLCLVAEKKGCTPQEVHSLVAAGQKTLHGTKADNVRFHDDRSSYTGQHRYNENHEGAGVSSPKERATYDAGTPGDWAPVEVAFKNFDKDGHGLDSSKFAKLCEDAGLLDTGFTKGDVDVVFSVMRSKRVSLERFPELLRKVAEKKEEPLRIIQERVAACSGPSLRCTATDNVRLHDDRSTYTGTHAGK